MAYLTQSTNSSTEVDSKYSTHLSSLTKFPHIIRKHNDLRCVNFATFYPNGDKKTISNTNKTIQKQNTTIPLSKSLTGLELQEINGLKVPQIYSPMRNTLYTRYTLKDWIKSAQNLYDHSHKMKHLSENVRCDSLRLGREINDRTNQSQQDTSKKLDFRISDIEQAKSSLMSEINGLILETDQLSYLKLVTEKTLKESEFPLHVAQECLYNREKRQGIDLVHDAVEKELIKEIDTIKKYQDDMGVLIEQAEKQLKSNGATQFELEKDARDKFHSLKLDQIAHSFRNHSMKLTYYNCIENLNNCISTPESWLAAFESNLRRSESERNDSKKLRDEMERCLNQYKEDMLKQWAEVNNTLKIRIQETVEERNKDQAHLKSIQQEIFDMEKNIEFLKKSINDINGPKTTVHNRLYTRLERPNMDACDDIPRNRLIQELEEIKSSSNSLNDQLRMSEDVLQNLLVNKSTLEADLNLKINSLFIDREKCLGIRNTFYIFRS